MAHIESSKVVYCLDVHSLLYMGGDNGRATNFLEFGREVMFQLVLLLLHHFGLFPFYHFFTHPIRGLHNLGRRPSWLVPTQMVVVNSLGH